MTSPTKALLSVCLGADSTAVAWSKHPEEFAEIRAMVMLQPADHYAAQAYTVGCMPHIDYVIQYVASLGRSMTFYRDVIGLKVRIEGDGYVEFEMDNTKFSLFERSKLPELIGLDAGKAPCGEIGFIIDDVAAEAERLKELGVEILTGPMDRPWGERTLHISDPDGNVIEFAQKLGD